MANLFNAIFGRSDDERAVRDSDIYDSERLPDETDVLDALRTAQEEAARRKQEEAQDKR